MKRLATILAAFAVMLLVLSGCAPAKKVYRLELIVKGTQTEFWQSVYDGAKAATGNNAQLLMLGPEVEKDYRRQVELLEGVIERAPDAVILAAGDYFLMAEPMEKVVEAGIPVIMVDSAVDSTKWVSFVTTDNHKLGQTLAQQLQTRLTQSGTVGVISFVKSSYPSVERENGFRAEMEASARHRLLDTVYCDSNIDIANALTRKMVQENPDLVAIVGLNAQSATGAARALEELGRTDVFMAGIDCTVEQADYVELGIMDAAVLQNPYAMGYYSVKATLDHLSGRPVEKMVYTDIHVIDKENLFDDKYQQLIFPFA